MAKAKKPATKKKLKIDAGKFYRLRCGIKARVYATENIACDNIHGAICYNDGWDITVWHKNGRYYRFGISDKDIVAEWEE